MDMQRLMVVAAGMDRMTKPALVDYLIEHGTIYPNRAGLLKWSKQDLVNAAAERVIDEIDRGLAVS